MTATPPVLPSAAARSDASAHGDETVYHALARWATHTGRLRLALWAIGGALEAVAVALILPRFWVLSPLLLSVAAIGAWGLATQRILALDAAQAAARVQRLALRATRIVAVTVGTIAAIAAAYGALLLLLGPRWGPSGG
jgi:hypothetical protein